MHSPRSFQHLVVTSYQPRRRHVCKEKGEYKWQGQEKVQEQEKGQELKEQEIGKLLLAAGPHGCGGI